MTRSEARVHEMLDESGIPQEGAEALVEYLATLERSVDEAAPQPGPELAALMAGTARPAPALAFPGRRGRMLAVAAVAFGTVAAGGVAAAANELPAGAQQLVAELSEKFLPFELPRPDESREDQDAPARPRPAPVDETTYVELPAGPGAVIPSALAERSAQPSPTPTPSAAPSPSPSASAPVALDPPFPAPSGSPGVSPAPSAQPSAGPEGDPQSGPPGEAKPSGAVSPGTEAAPAPSGNASPSPGSDPGAPVNSRKEAGDDDVTGPDEDD